MFCRRKQWEGANFPRQLFHQTRSKRGRVLMHSKVAMSPQSVHLALTARRVSADDPRDL